MSRPRVFFEKDKKMIGEFVKNDFKARYSGFYLGVIWGVMQPFITVLIYWFIFIVGLWNGEHPDGSPYIIWMMSGIVAQLFFSDAPGAGTNAFLEYSYLVRKLNFSMSLIPLVKVGAPLIIYAIFLGIVIIILNFSGYTTDWYYLQLMYYVACNFMLVFAVVLFTSSVTVYMRDVSQLVGIFIQIGFWAIPIAWGSEVLGGGLRFTFQLNPVYYLVESYRDPLYAHVSVWDEPLYTLYFWVVTGTLFALGMYTFRKLKPYFADVL